MPQSLYGLCQKPRGLVLVTGPTAGKSTTLSALIDEINRTRSDHIITIEDPIEFLHKHKNCVVNQREIGPDATSFADALRGAPPDPDVILLGEMRDHETISTALTAAETGHLVFATLHTQDASSTGRPPDRRLPGRAAGTDPDTDRRAPPGRRHPGAAPDRRRDRASARRRDPVSGRRRPEPDPPGEGRAGLLDHADRNFPRDDDARAVARRPRPARRDRPGALALEPGGAAARPDPAEQPRARAAAARGSQRPPGCGSLTWT